MTSAFPFPSRPPLALGLALALAIPALVPGTARSEDDLRVELERIYRGWTGALIQRNVASWELHTAKHRQVLTRNFVVSRKAPWPDAIFSLPFRLPEIATLTHLATLRKGDTANAVYYGKVDFGVLEGTVPNNLLMLKFVREEGRWKFDNTRFFNLETDPEVRQLAAAGELGFLESPEFQPTGEIPPVPRLIAGFDHPGEVWIASIGYATTVTIGDLHETVVENNVVTDVIIGGLSRSGLPIRIETREIPVPPGEDRRLAVEVYALRQTQPAVKVWEFRPTADADLSAPHTAKVYANAVTMRE